MRVPFHLQGLQPLSFSVEGTTYSYETVTRLAHRQNLDANIQESVIETPEGKKVWLTVVGDEDQMSPFGIQHGWYVAKLLDTESADSLVRAFAAFGNT
ncbi:MAG: hypothetical protein ABSH47_10030 [Bryobacteraceae bacterium]|jgi:hypothetical protein